VVAACLQLVRFWWKYCHYCWIQCIIFILKRNIMMIISGCSKTEKGTFRNWLAQVVVELHDYVCLTAGNAGQPGLASTTTLNHFGFY